MSLPGFIPALAICGMLLTNCGVPEAWKDQIVISEHGPYEIPSCQTSELSQASNCQQAAAAKCTELGLEFQGVVNVHQKSRSKTAAHVICFEATY